MRNEHRRIDDSHEFIGDPRFRKQEKLFFGFIGGGKNADFFCKEADRTNLRYRDAISLSRILLRKLR